MKATMLKLLTLAGAAVLATGFTPLPRGVPAGEDGGDKTLSPYFFVKSDDPTVDRLPLKETRADVDIAGVIARVTVTQVYENTGKRPIEAKYVFPASTRAAVHGLTMTIGERTIVAEINKRKEAREKYEQAKEQGKTASLLEQQRPNVFQMNVANILPGDVIKVKLRYSEMLVPEGGVYSFVYPTVVGPRYSETPAEGAPDTEKWIESPYRKEGEKPLYTFDMNVGISSGIALRKISCPSHEANVAYTDKKTAEVSLSPEEKHGGNRDFILKYVLADKHIQTGLMLYPEDGEQFFLAMVEPPQRVETNMIPPREYVFIVDVSGSMNGFPLDISKTLMRNLLTYLRPTDTFNIVFFAGGSFVFAEQSQPANEDNVQKAIDAVNNQRGGGGTRLLEGLQAAYNLPRIDKDVSRTAVLITDGYVSVEQEAFDMIKDNLGRTNVFGFGIGSSVNRYLIEGVAKCGRGRPFVITKPAEAPKTAEAFRTYISSPLLTDIKVMFNGVEAYDIEPPQYPDVFAQRPLVITGKYRGDPRGTIEIRGYTGEGEYKSVLHMQDGSIDETNEPLKYVWVRKRVARLADYVGKQKMKENKEEVTRLGLTYNLLTRYTSFIAVDKRVRREDGELEVVQQPLPLPQGVSNLAVGGRVRGRRMAKAAAYNMARPAHAPTGTPAREAVNGSGLVLRETEEKAPVADKTEQARSLERVPLPGNAALNVTVTKLATDGTGKLTREHIRKALIGLAAKTPAFQKAFANAPPIREVQVRVTFDHGIARNVTFLTADIGAQRRKVLERELRKLITRILPPQYAGKMTLTFAMKR